MKRLDGGVALPGDGDAIYGEERPGEGDAECADWLIEPIVLIVIGGVVLALALRR